MTLLEEMKVSIDTMTAGEKFLGSLQVTVLGVAIVFMALAMLFIIIKILDTTIHKAESSSAKKKEAKAAAEAKTREPAATEPVTVQSEADEGELVAVIAAAVAASLHTSTHQIIVRNIIRTPDNAPAWNRLGRMQQIDRQPR